MNLLSHYKSLSPFSEDEAWLLFKLAAIGEACGWTILISGLAVKAFITPGSSIPVQIAGQIHGLLFLIYVSAAIGLAPSLGWSLKRTFIAGLCSVPPYGSLLFEIWAGHMRRKSNLANLAKLLGYKSLVTGRIQEN